MCHHWVSFRTKYWPRERHKRRIMHRFGIKIFYFGGFPQNKANVQVSPLWPLRCVYEISPTWVFDSLVQQVQTKVRLMIKSQWIRKQCGCKEKRESTRAVVFVLFHTRWQLVSQCRLRRISASWHHWCHTDVVKMSPADHCHSGSSISPPCLHV